MKYLQQLDQLLQKEGVSKNSYCLHDETGHVRFGDGYGLDQIVYHPQTKKWCALIHEAGREDVDIEGEFDTSREACICFLKMTDGWNHLASRIPDFEEKAAS